MIEIHIGIQYHPNTKYLQYAQATTSHLLAHNHLDHPQGHEE